MGAYLLYFAAFTAGIALAVQSGFNAQLGQTLKSPLLATLVAYAVSTLLAFLYIAVTQGVETLHSRAHVVPTYLWIAGGFFSLVGIAMYYILIPKIGLAKMFTFGLSGQMLFVVVAGNFGWFGMPGEPMNFQKLVGVSMMLAGVAFITYEG